MTIKIRRDQRVESGNRHRDHQPPHREPHAGQSRGRGLLASLVANPAFTPGMRRKSLFHAPGFVDMKGILTLYNFYACQIGPTRGSRLVSEPAAATIEHTAPARPSHHLWIAAAFFSISNPTAAKTSSARAGDFGSSGHCIARNNESGPINPVRILISGKPRPIVRI
jgi:hypothetical protein